MPSTPNPPEGTILGLHLTGAQSSAAIFRNGQLLAAVAEERLSRQKRSREFPFKAIRYCLGQAGLDDLTQVDHVVVPWNPAVHMANLNLSGFTSWRRYDPEWLYIVPNQLMQLMPGAGAADTRLMLGAEDRPYRVSYLTHHRAHAGWAYASPFDEAAIAIVDEYGEQASITLGTIRGNRVEFLRSIDFPHSLGVFYATFTSYLGFTPNSDEWKVMGAAAYGDPERFAKQIRALLKHGGGNLVLDQNCFTFANTRIGGYFGDHLTAEIGLPPRTSDMPMEQEHYDLAASCQKVFEEILFGLLNWLHARTGMKNLVINGGCAMNSLANGRISEHTPFDNLYISPAAADNGTAISGPLWMLGEMGGDRLFRTSIGAYTGPEFEAQEIRDTLDRHKVRYRQPIDLLDEVTDAICAGRIVGWHQGRMEYGERALGNRSILADPRRTEMKDLINASVKYREPFRPFAPSILESRAHEFFDMPAGARVDYMERVFRFRQEKQSQVPAVVHADGTGRLQTVTLEDNALYHALIERFYAKTGIPILLNTSFNLNGEPIVCSPDDALRTFVTSGLDMLAIGPFILDKQG